LFHALVVAIKSDASARSCLDQAQARETPIHAATWARITRKAFTRSPHDEEKAYIAAADAYKAEETAAYAVDEELFTP
jgi:hypothetical protein